jgi:acetyl esterase
VTGRVYLERGRPVVVIAAWRPARRGDPSGPRNVWIRREDGSEVIRPFRGLRRLRPS